VQSESKAYIQDRHLVVMDNATLYKLKLKLQRKEAAIHGMREELEQAAEYVYCTWEECPRWVRKIMAISDIENTKAWYNLVLRRILITIGQCQRLRKQIKNYGKAESKEADKQQA
jgi:hypothetical protein